VRGEKIYPTNTGGVKKGRKTFQISDDKEEEIFFCCPDDATFFLKLGK
jgi:hypothetical protein